MSFYREVIILLCPLFGVFFIGGSTVFVSYTRAAGLRGGARIRKNLLQSYCQYN